MIRCITPQNQTRAAQAQLPMAELEAQAARLRSSIKEIGALADDGFSEIEAIALLALSALEAPATYNNLETIALALRNIASTAQRVWNCVGAEAEHIGCGYVDDAQQRRYAARSQHQEERQRIAATMAQNHAGPT